MNPYSRSMGLQLNNHWIDYWAVSSPGVQPTAQSKVVDVTTIIASEGDVLLGVISGMPASGGPNAIWITGFLVDKTVDGVHLHSTQNYTVPSGKTLVLFNGTNYPEIHFSNSSFNVGSKDRFGYLMDE